jgi:hypothetical protein
MSFHSCDRSKDILMRVIVQNLPPESTTVEKVTPNRNYFVSLSNCIGSPISSFQYRIILFSKLTGHDSKS